MTKKTKTALLEPTADAPQVIEHKRIRKSYTLGDDYKAWKEYCDSLKASAAFHSAEAVRFRNTHKKYYENGAEGFCRERDERAWEKANNLITIAQMKADERANAWKSVPVERLDVSKKLMNALKENGFDILEKVAEWANDKFPKKKKHISDASIGTIRDALAAFIAPYHKPILDEELARAKAEKATLEAQGKK